MKLTALLNFNHPIDAIFEEPSPEVHTRATATKILRGTDFEADDESAVEYIERGYAVRADSLDAEFVRSAARTLG